MARKYLAILPRKNRAERSDCELCRLSYMLGLGCNCRPKEQENEKHISNKLIRNSCCCALIGVGKKWNSPAVPHHVGCGLWLGTHAPMCNTLAPPKTVFYVSPSAQPRLETTVCCLCQKKKKRDMNLHVCMVYM